MSDGKAEARDRALMARLLAGEVAALRELYEAHVDALYAFAYARVGRDAQIAEEVVQETFLQAMDAFADFDPARGRLRTWLCVRSRNVIRKSLRDRSRPAELATRVDEGLTAIYQTLGAAGPPSDELVEREQTRDLVHMAIAQMPDRYRRALEARYLEESGLDEVARRLEVSESAAKSLLARARRAFREAFLTLSRASFEVSS